MSLHSVSRYVSICLILINMGRSIGINSHLTRSPWLSLEETFESEMQLDAFLFNKKGGKQFHLLTFSVVGRHNDKSRDAGIFSCCDDWFNRFRIASYYRASLEAQTGNDSIHVLEMGRQVHFRENVSIDNLSMTIN